MLKNAISRKLAGAEHGERILYTRADLLADSMGLRGGCWVVEPIREERGREKSEKEGGRGRKIIIQINPTGGKAVGEGYLSVQRVGKCSNGT
jgi:hypothetical protein